MSEQPRMILYARVSTDSETQEESLGKQIARMEAACAAHNMTPVVRIEEQASAKDIKGRPKFRLAIQMLESGEADGMMVADISRLTRDVGDLSMLLKEVFKGHRLHIVQEMLDTTSPLGRCTAHILTAINQMFREQVAIKTRDALTKLKQAGKKIGSRPPYGWKLDSTGEAYEVCEAEQRCLHRIMELYSLGRGFTQISTQIHKEGYLTAGQRNGTNPLAMWTGTTVKRIVERELERRKKVME